MSRKKTLILYNSRLRNMDIAKVSKRIYQLQKKKISELGIELTSELVFLHLSEEVEK